MDRQQIYERFNEITALVKTTGDEETLNQLASEAAHMNAQLGAKEALFMGFVSEAKDGEAITIEEVDNLLQSRWSEDIAALILVHNRAVEALAGLLGEETTDNILSADQAMTIVRKAA